MNGLLLWISIVLLILLIGLVGILIAVCRMLKVQSNMITNYKEIEGILNKKIKLLEEYVQLLKSPYKD
jgi:hypothetical protein